MRWMRWINRQTDRWIDSARHNFWGEKGSLPKTQRGTKKGQGSENARMQGLHNKRAHLTAQRLPGGGNGFNRDVKKTFVLCTFFLFVCFCLSNPENSYGKIRAKRFISSWTYSSLPLTQSYTL